MKIHLEQYKPEWKKDFEQHKKRISTALQNFHPSIDHIGSTSLRSIAAKPIIDILVGLQSDSQLDEVIKPMLATEYTYIEKFTSGMPYRWFFVKLIARTSDPLPNIIRSEDTLAFGRQYDSVTNIHVMEKGTYHWIRHIAFRDYLLTHQEARLAYEALKKNIAEIDFNDPLEYNTHKEAFIAEHQEKAISWFQNRNNSVAVNN